LPPAQLDHALAARLQCQQEAPQLNAIRRWFFEMIRDDLLQSRTNHCAVADRALPGGGGRNTGQAAAACTGVAQVSHTGHAIGDQQRQLQLWRQSEGVHVRIPEAGNEELAAAIDARSGKRCRDGIRRSDVDDAIVFDHHSLRGGGATTAVRVHDCDIVDDQSR